MSGRHKGDAVLERRVGVQSVQTIIRIDALLSWQQDSAISLICHGIGPDKAVSPHETVRPDEAVGPH